jgi:hypothetical protein
MNATAIDPVRPALSPFDLADDAAYRHWRAAKLARRARGAGELIVDVADPEALTAAERHALLQRCADWNMAVYRCRGGTQGKATVLAIGRQLGLQRLDANWLADEDGLSSITVSRASDGRGGFIPYTDRALKWHTDGYYYPPEQRIRAMLLHCVRPARSGGVNALLDHELAYIALRDASPRWLQALMEPDAMTIPAREDADGATRPAQAGPVFSVEPADGTLHMRYTARTRSIVWKDDAATLKAVAFLERLLAGDHVDVLHVRLDAGMGIVANNVLHERSAFVDDPAYPRLVYRARYLDRVAPPEAQWRNG